jgi:hypothetical protein
MTWGWEKLGRISFLHKCHCTVHISFLDQRVKSMYGQQEEMLLIYLLVYIIHIYIRGGGVSVQANHFVQIKMASSDMQLLYIHIWRNQIILYCGMFARLNNGSN